MFDYPLFEFRHTISPSPPKYWRCGKGDLDVLHMHYAIPHATAAYLAREMYRPKRYLPFVTTSWH
jgi:hypothetical protein